MCSVGSLLRAYPLAHAQIKDDCKAQREVNQAHCPTLHPRPWGERMFHLLPRMGVCLGGEVTHLAGERVIGSIAVLVSPSLNCPKARSSYINLYSGQFPRGYTPQICAHRGL